MIKKGMIVFTLICLSSVIWLPFLMLFGNSLMGGNEINECFSPVLLGIGEQIKFRILPEYPTFRPYVELLFDSSGFYTMFWNSCKQVFGIMAGICIISVPAAWAFGRYDFYGKRILFFLYMILMIMPFQVTMVSNYLVLDRLHMMDTHSAIIIPGIFSAFPVFILTKFYRTISMALIEAAQMDGAGELRIFLSIGIPLGKPGLMSVLLLCFMEYWNAMEQPLTFLRNKSLWPMSLYLPNITNEKAALSFAASVIAMLPAFLLFLAGQDYLEQGIEASGIKE